MSSTAASKSFAQGTERHDWGAARQNSGNRAAAALQHPAAPAALTATLLVAGYVVTVMMGQQSAWPPASLSAIVLFVLALARATGNRRTPPVPTLSRAPAVLLRAICLTATAAEMIHFGVPLFGGVPYNEFGWPVVHHLAAGYWVLVLFGRNRKVLDLGISLAIAALLFNRQMALFAVLAYLMTTRMSARQLMVAGMAAIGLAMALGSLRNRALDVDVSALADTIDLPYVSSLFFLYLYLTGPLYVGLGLQSDLWESQLSTYWNTVPEWAIFSDNFPSVPSATSFALFYGLAAILSMAMRRSASWPVRCFGWLIHCYAFFAFFSGVLISTPIIANLLSVVVAGALLPSRRRT